MPTGDSYTSDLNLAELDQLERKWGHRPETSGGHQAADTTMAQLRPLLDLVDRLGATLERALTTTQRIEEFLHRRHFSPGRLQKMTDAVDDYRRAKGEDVEPRPTR